MGYAVAVVVVLPWVAMAGPTEVATDGTAARAVATTVALAVEAPCTMESLYPCRRNPRISTVALGRTNVRPRKCRGHRRGPPPKSQIMCIREISRRSAIPFMSYIYVLMHGRAEPPSLAVTSITIQYHTIP